MKYAKTSAPRTDSKYIPERAHIDSTDLLIDTIERLGKWLEGEAA